MNLNNQEILILILASSLLLVCIFIKLYELIKIKKIQRRFYKGRKAEKAAEKVLTKNGYTIIDVQKSKPLLLAIGSKIHRYLVRIDYLVRKRGRIYVVEVKSGEKIPYITNRETRRQMLEYYLAFQPSGILLLNMKNKNISEIRFQLENAPAKWLNRIVYFILGIIFTYFLQYLLREGWK